MKFSIVLLVFIAILGAASLAFPFSQSASIVQAILSEPIPAAIPPLPIDTEDYALLWVGEKIPDVEVSLEKGSLQWVRLFDILVLPRAVLTVSALDAVSGDIFYAGFSHPMVISQGVGRVTVPLALISGEQNTIQIRLQRREAAPQGSQPSQGSQPPQGLQTLRGKIELHYRPRHPKEAIAIDSSCSSFGVEATPSADLFSDQWLYIGCRFTHLGQERRIVSLELYTFWDHVGSSIKINGMETPSAQGSLWTVKLNPSRTPLLLQVNQQEKETVAVRYVMPEKIQLAFLGAGIGPYVYRYNAPDIAVDTVAPILTLYGSYWFNQTTRLVMFDATSLHSPLYTDLGIYLNYEAAKVLDRRMTINILIGGHVVAFEANNQVNFSGSAPQGVEFVYRDFYKKRYALSGGGFILPETNGKAYQNVWLRWGTATFFAEFNFIGWSEPVGNGRVDMRSFGISIGGPLARFF